jgi:hypothetical protein
MPPAAVEDAEHADAAGGHAAEQGEQRSRGGRTADNQDGLGTFPSQSNAPQSKDKPRSPEHHRQQQELDHRHGRRNGQRGIDRMSERQIGQDREECG